MGNKLDRTTGLHAIVGPPASGAWYLIVALDDQHNTRVVPLDDGAELVFGRSAEASVVIEHEAVSRRHTAIRRRGDAVIVEDLDSRNGTSLNGTLIVGVRRASAGDVIGIGPVTAIVRVGGTTELPVDVRLVCATHRDLETEVQRGRFREDLFFRIAAFVIPVPPLRDRRSEIAPLAVHFAHEIATDLHQPAVGFTPEALDALQQASWPGNVRELRNAIERAVVLSEGGKIGREHLPEPIVEQTRTPPRDALDVRQRVASVEREAVIAALDASDGNQTQAARRLGVSRFALIRMMAKHDIKRR